MKSKSHSNVENASALVITLRKRRRAARMPDGPLGRVLAALILATLTGIALAQGWWVLGREQARIMPEVAGSLDTEGMTGIYREAYKRARNDMTPASAYDTLRALERSVSR